MNKGKGNMVKNSVASIEPDADTLGISEKQSRISAIVMWYLPIFRSLEAFLLEPKDC